MSGVNLLQKPTCLRFAPEQSNCPCCKQRLLIRRTRSRKIITLDIGPFTANETLLYCSNCSNQPILRSEALARQVAPGAIFAYDIMVYIGLAKYQRFRTTDEVVTELVTRNVCISPSEVHVQAKRFILYLAEVHRESQDALNELLKQQGGYILHLDGTCDGASSHLISALDGISNLVLMNVKIESEKAEYVEPMLSEINRIHGAPLAIVTDMSKAFSLAINETFKLVPHYICHFHFLRDIGKDLLTPDYKRIREILRSHGITALLRRRKRELRSEMGSDIELIEPLIKSITKGISSIDSAVFTAPLAYAMLEWTLAGKKKGNGYGFPFDLPLLAFHERLMILHQALVQIQVASQSIVGESKCLVLKLIKDLIPIIEDQELKTHISAAKEKKVVFDQLRNAMRLAQPDSNKGLNDDGDEEVDMPTIKKNVSDFYASLRRRSNFANDDPYGKMASQIKKYWGKLFAKPMKISTLTGEKIIYPNRTNNSLERLFRSLNRDNRRQTGMNSMQRRIDSMISATPLVKNLDTPAYMEIILDGEKTIEDRFSRIDSGKIKEGLRLAMQEVGRKLPGLHNILRLPRWPLAVAELLFHTKSA
jgi:hypothetical protein